MALNYQSGGVQYDSQETMDTSSSSVAGANMEQSQASAQAELNRRREEAARRLRSMQSQDSYNSPSSAQEYSRGYHDSYTTGRSGYDTGYGSQPQNTGNVPFDSSRYTGTRPMSDYERIQYQAQQIAREGRVTGRNKSKLAAGLLHIFGGSLGLGNFYTGYYGKAITQLLLTVLTGGFGSMFTSIWGLIDGIRTLTASPSSKYDYDANGNLLV